VNGDELIRALEWRVIQGDKLLLHLEATIIGGLLVLRREIYGTGKV